MAPLTRLLVRLRRPLHIRLTAPPDKAAAALRGIAAFVDRRTDLRHQRIRIDLTLRPGREGDR